MLKKSKFQLIIRLFSILICISVVVASIILPTNIKPVYASTSSDLNQRLTDLNNQINLIKQQKQDIENKLSQENVNQNSYSSQINTYNSKIQQLQLSIDEKTKTIQSLETQIELTSTQINDTKIKINELQLKITTLNDQYSATVNSHFQNSFHSTFNSIFENNFETFLVQREFSNTIAQDNKRVTDDLSKTKAELDVQNQALAAALKQQQDSQDQIKQETSDLGNDQSSLSKQKSQQTSLLNQSKQTSVSLQQQSIALQKKYQDALNQYLQELANGVSNGAAISKGDAIAKMGRTGYVLNCTSDGNCYYPDPVKEPCAGAHTHIEVWTQNSSNKFLLQNPINYFPNTISYPFHNWSITQYFGSSPYYGGSIHTGVDFVGDSQCGTPIYAGIDGIISYSCYHSSYVNDNTYVATIYNPQNKLKVIYLHIQKIPGVTCS